MSVGVVDRWFAFPGVALAFGLLLWAQTAAGATIVVNNLDAGTGLGFDDPTAVAPVTGNPGVTLGAQRLNAFRAAAEQWAAILDSPVTIQIDAQMPAQSCTPTSGTLGSAGANTVHRDFDNAPVADTWYPQALANSLAGVDLSAASDISANFNRDVDDDPNCLSGLTWSYVIGALSPPGTLAFTDTVLHEIGHGIGVAGFTNLATGALFFNGPDHYGTWLYSETLGQPWTSLSNAQRLATATDTGNLTWAGSEVGNVDDFLSAGVQSSGRVRMYAPTTLAPGSSVNHFDTALTPNELMEPFATDVNEQLVTNHLLLDVGWNLQLATPVSISDGFTEIVAGSQTSYQITVQNDGPGNIRMVNATVNSGISQLLGVSWTCTGNGGGSCGSPSGTDAIIDEDIILPLGSSVTFQLNGTVDPEFSGPLNASVSLTTPDNIINTVSGTASDATNVLPLDIVVSPTNGLVTGEDGTSDSFSIVLASAPTDDVTIGISSNDETEGIVSPNSLVFTGSNWDIAQTVTVTGVSDADADGAIAYLVITAPAVSADTAYNGLNAADVSVTNLDNNVGILVSSISGNTSEPAGTATFTVTATSPPSSAVTVGLTSSDESEGTVPVSVVLPAGTTAAQTVTVTGADDALNDGDVGYTIITAAATSADANYNGINPDDVNVTNEDDDYLVGGFVTGNVGSGLVLQNNGSDDLAISGTGAFNFDTPVSDGNPYSVSLLTQPSEPAIECSIVSGVGTISGADVTTVAVNCVVTCNFVEVGNVTVNSTVEHESCTMLLIGPDYVAEDGADVQISSGEEIWFLPGTRVQQGATLNAAVCGQSLCEASDPPAPIPNGCHSCVVAVCDVDDFCCNTAWDQLCVDAVQPVCGLVCD